MGFTELLQKVDDVAAQNLGGPVVYRAGDGTEKPTTGIFDAAYELADVQRPGASSSNPAVFLHRLDELPSQPRDDRDARIIYAGITYRIFEAKPDGLGGALLLLVEV